MLAAEYNIHVLKRRVQTSVRGLPDKIKTTCIMNVFSSTKYFLIS